MTEYDNLDDATRDHRRPPRDVVPPAGDADVAPIPTGAAVDYTSYEIGPDGVTRETGTAWVAAPITDTEQLMRRQREREDREDT